MEGKMTKSAQLKDLIPDDISQGDIADQCEVTQQSVSLWIKAGKVPPKRAKVFSRITGIPLHVVNPDVYEAPANE
ncbi:hypothetical protein AYI77_02040 [Shewanella algae]|nr:hypothetical protein AYI77_02040 [Shewanella algae]